MVLLTAEEAAYGSEVCMADFRDTHALFHEASGKFVGLCEDGAMRFGKLPLAMVDGIWYLEEDSDAQERYKDVPTTEASLRRIG